MLFVHFYIDLSIMDRWVYWEVYMYIAYIGTNMRERISSTSSKKNEFILRIIMYNEKAFGNGVYWEKVYLEKRILH